MMEWWNDGMLELWNFGILEEWRMGTLMGLIYYDLRWGKSKMLEVRC